MCLTCYYAELIGNGWRLPRKTSFVYAFTKPTLLTMCLLHLDPYYFLLLSSLCRQFPGDSYCQPKRTKTGGAAVSESCMDCLLISNYFLSCTYHVFLHICILFPLVYNSNSKYFISLTLCNHIYKTSSVQCEITKDSPFRYMRGYTFLYNMLWLK